MQFLASLNRQKLITFNRELSQKYGLNSAVKFQSNKQKKTTNVLYRQDNMCLVMATHGHAIIFCSYPSTM